MMMVMVVVVRRRRRLLQRPLLILLAPEYTSNDMHKEDQGMVYHADYHNSHLSLILLPLPVKQRTPPHPA